MQNLQRAVFYDGPSAINGERIVAVVTGLRYPASNPKTGPMAQVWSMPADAAPITAVKSGKDESVCGDCPLRPTNHGGCYVTVGRAPAAVYAAIERSRVSVSPARAGALTRSCGARLGAWGDPAALPISVLREFLSAVKFHTGYTHRWRDPSAQEYRHYLMASVETIADAEQARELEWRTFRILLDAAKRGPTEFLCPASQHAKVRKTCAECRACDGRSSLEDRRAHAVVVAHGSAATLSRVSGWLREVAV